MSCVNFFSGRKKKLESRRGNQRELGEDAFSSISRLHFLFLCVFHIGCSVSKSDRSYRLSISGSRKLWLARKRKSDLSNCSPSLFDHEPPPSPSSLLPPSSPPIPPLSTSFFTLLPPNPLPSATPWLPTRIATPPSSPSTTTQTSSFDRQTESSSPRRSATSRLGC